MIVAESGEILQIAVLNKAEENCQSNNLDALGVSRVLDQCFQAQISLAVVSTDEYSAVKS